MGTNLRDVNGLQARESVELAVITPIWKLEPDQDEVIRLRLTESSTAGLAHIFLHPEGLALEQWQKLFPLWTFRSVAPEHLASIRAYSQWLLEPAFYEQFAEFSHILIAQLDSVLLQPLPPHLFRYDYVGAPWDPPWRVVVYRKQMRIIRIAGKELGRRLDVGNGGLSLRRTSALRAATAQLRGFTSEQLLGEANEDALLAYFRRRLHLKFAPVDEARCLVDLRQDANVDAWTVGVHGLTSATPIACECIRAIAHKRGITA